MKQSYFSTAGVWLKGNLHSHTTVSDGALSPEEIEKVYREHGYDFFSMTDHNLFVPHEKGNREMLLLTGVEHDLTYSRFKCIHVVGTGAPGRTETDYPCIKYSPDEINDQELIDRMRNDGQFVVLAHPVWSRMEPEELRALSGFHAIEVYNHGCENLCHAGHGEVYWDMLLREGKRLLATASDDTHLPGDKFGGWICVKAAEKTEVAINKALFEGQFYASSGPKIIDFGTDGDIVYLACSRCREIHFVSYPPRGKSFFAGSGEGLTEAVYTRKGGESYLRAECIDDAGHAAWTNPIYFD